MTNPITIETRVSAPPDVAWQAYTDPDAIKQWNFASSDWCCPSAAVGLREGGRHVARMEAKDGSMGFDFAGTYESVMEPTTINLRLDDGRLSRTTFEPEGEGTLVRTVFDADSAHSVELQQQGWQAILDNYAGYVSEDST